MVVTWENHPVVDNSDDDLLLLCDSKNGSPFPIGDTLVTCTSVDNYGNAAQCQFIVNISGTYKDLYCSREICDLIELCIVCIQLNNVQPAGV